MKSIVKQTSVKSVRLQITASTSDIRPRPRVGLGLEANIFGLGLKAQGPGLGLVPCALVNITATTRCLNKKGPTQSSMKTLILELKFF